tara:strand:+ start:30 stop:935 length:906 start_codon:yes stop_codon:yes gene_type:complete
MKKLILLCVLATSLNGQNFVSFPDSNARWINSYSTLNTSGQFYYYELAHTLKFCLSGEDTLINIRNYSKINYCGASTAYFGAIRDTAGQVFLVPADSTEALLLYDFNLLPGDTLKDIYSIGFGNYWPGSAPRFEYLGDTINPLIVQQVDTVYTSRGLQRIVYLGTSGGPWIEGVGNSQGLFWDPFANISNFQILLECMSIGDSIYYDGYIYPPASALAGPCDLGLHHPSMSIQALNIYPNPSRGLINLTNQEPGILSVYSLDGEFIECHSIDVQGRLNLEDLAKGLYVLEFGNTRFRWLKI